MKVGFENIVRGEFQFHRRLVEIAFENGVVVSASFGTGTYSSNLDRPDFKEECDLVEVAIIHNGVFITGKLLPHEDSVKGFVSMAEYADILIKARDYKVES